MDRTPYLTALLLALSLTRTAAAELGDLHLSPTPRNTEEAARVQAVTAPATEFSAPEPYEANPGGAATVPARTDTSALGLASANMAPETRLDFELGNSLFEKLWVSSPASTKASDGLGPLYNARSCQRCHIRDGRGHPPEGPDDSAVSMFLRIAVPSDTPDAAMAAVADYLATRPDPTYGRQLQDVSLAGIAPEARLTITYEEMIVPLSGGETARLRKPTYTPADLAYGPLAPGAMLSPRVAPAMTGLGLLEAIPAADILAGADPDDADGDGISGRANIVWSPEYDRPMLGRFGLKAGTATVHHQSAAAFSTDIGISTPLFPAAWGDCTAAQTACRTAPDGATPAHDNLEISAEGMDLVTFYARNLAVPARRDLDDPQVLRGKELFYTTGCTACHRPKFVTHRLPDRPEQSFQLIWPYSDLLLHDMGPGLADGFAEARATGREWRTPPLWGIGLSAQVTGHSTYLHDGRARSLLEAVLWHGGEAEAARDRVTTMPAEDRAALIRFLESL